MREAFAHSLQTQKRLQDKVTSLKTPILTPLSPTDSVFKKSQTKLDYKLAAFAKKTSNTLDLFHQKLEDHKASTNTATDHLDTRMSQIKNSTNLMIDGLTNKC